MAESDTDDIVDVQTLIDFGSIHESRTKGGGTMNKLTDYMKTAIALGNDTDTTAAVAGGIAGIRSGLKGIPRRFLLDLRDQSLYRPLLDKLLRGRVL